MPSGDKKLLGLIVVLSLLDGFLTMVEMDAGVVTEANPFMGLLFCLFGVGAVFLKTLMTGAGVYFLLKVSWTRYAWCYWVVAATGFAYIALTAWHVYIVQTACV